MFSIPYHTYSLVADDVMFCDYENKIHAMEMAKAGALKHIETLINEGEKSIEKLFQYRFDHYDDLNINLLDSTLNNLKKQLNKLL